MALGNRKISDVFNKRTGGSKDARSITEAKELEIKAEYDAGVHIADDGMFNTIAPALYAIQGLSDDIDELRRFTSNEIVAKTDTIAPPTSLSTTIVNDTIDLSFNKSTTADIDHYLVFNSIDGSTDYGLISVLGPDDLDNTMSVIDSTFSQTGTMAYRVYAVKNGVYSAAATTSQAFTISSLEPTNLSVTPLNRVYFIQWDPPSANARFVSNYKIYKHAHATQGSLSRSSATLVYTGNNTSYMYTVADEDKAKFHQFWVEITVA